MSLLSSIIESAHVRPPGECWMWQGALTNGYGTVNAVKDGRRSTTTAHRAVYEHLVGPIPDGMDLDHLCRTRACVNPFHLEPVTRRENLMRSDGFASINARKTHCPREHEYTPENTYWTQEGWRGCRTCTLARNAEWRERRRAA